MKRPLRFVFANDTSGFANWGCRATSGELVRRLRAILDRLGAYRLHSIPLRPAAAADERIAERRFALRAALRAGRPSSAQKRLVMTAARRLLGESHVRELAQSDCLVFQAEGALTGTSFTGAERVFVTSFLAKEVYGLPVISLNQSVFSADPAFEPVLKRCFGAHDIFAVREAASYRYARALGLSRVLLAPDAAFHVRPASADARRLVSPRVAGRIFCVSGSAVIQFASMPDYLRLVKRLAKALSLTPVFALSGGDDLEFLKFVRRTMPGARVLSPSVSPEQVAGVLRGSEFLLSGRYHMSILAARAGTPFVALSANTFKHEGLLELLGVGGTVLDFAQEAGVFSAAKRLFRERSLHVARLKRGMERVDALSAAADDLLSHRLGGLFEGKGLRNGAGKQAAALRPPLAPRRGPDRYGRAQRLMDFMRLDPRLLVR